ncbi:aminotransferase class III-fold pyridoxal phosphate-dependent enzyme [Pseudobacteriovorax antillogorgiicola]|uniref:Glutamate-1-semialdehyde aminotransferase n=1 Tax=Pseudobacteriovorax antillogorgiicola TaxID=1513793 RepID=A0A1Y6BJY5_9BACT|nr:aminotransferase class III-fold pyridoxal phosphate-dependent enzyme [Pseudobacteriovorax antillogorgiicola]TCS56297.1 glutamate-1-semialdehyde aminotransferase [Pseudobacteriovorax antillogorgiicola]SMF07381.1 Glutamate-1-semialdehyde aminotransferase [Pseudobacteriovorax antillogorgiicola]
MARNQELIDQLRTIFQDAAGADTQQWHQDDSFLALGLDSLLMTQVAATLKKTFKVKVGLRVLMESHDSLEKLGDFIAQRMPHDVRPTIKTQDSAKTPQLLEPNIGSTNRNSSNLIMAQIALMKQQLELLSTTPSNSPAPGPIMGETKMSTFRSAPTMKSPSKKSENFGAMAKIKRERFSLENQQKHAIQTFTEKYNKKTFKSKAFCQTHRQAYADPRVVTGFSPVLKELIYPIVTKQAQGARIWDLDDNSYIDYTCGFGSMFLGYQADFIQTALQQELSHGFAIGPQSHLAGEVANLFLELTGHERVSFANTGSEAVLGAIRIARTVTAKDKIVVFEGAYHGINDDVIVRGRYDKPIPGAPGISEAAVSQTIVLPYGEAESLEYIRQHGQDIAAVLVEPVQSRRPDFFPLAFLKQLRSLTRDVDSLMILDEVITGFRYTADGINGHHKIDADLVTYGKIPGGGLPIGAIAGKSSAMDTLDGGSWMFGDSSVPEVGVTYFAGTFVRHPLTLAAAKATLQHLKDAGPSLQETTAARAKVLCDGMNEIFKKHRVDFKVLRFSSQLYLKIPSHYPFGELFGAWLRYRGIHLLFGFPFFVSTAHSDSDIATTLQIMDELVAEMTNLNFLPTGG